MYACECKQYFGVSICKGEKSKYLYPFDESGSIQNGNFMKLCLHKLDDLVELPTCFKNLTNITHVSILSGKLQSTKNLPPNSQIVNLRHNKIVQVVDIPKSVEELFISNNSIEQFDNTLSLKTVDLTGNKTTIFDRLPVGSIFSEANSTLETVICHEDTTKLSLGYCPKLKRVEINKGMRSISISLADLTFVDLRSIDSLEKLELVSCSNLEYIGLPPNLKVLKLTSCNLENVFDLKIPNNLHELYISGNRLKEIKIPRNLRVLYCSGNLVKKLIVFGNEKLYILCNSCPDLEEVCCLDGAKVVVDAKNCPILIEQKN